MVLAHALLGDLLNDTDSKVVADASRQPFLWRSLHRQLSPETLLDGRHVGYVLSSFWTDPITKNTAVVIRSPEPGGVEARLSYCDQEAMFAATMPLQLDGAIRDCNIDVMGGPIKLQGHAPHGSGAIFQIIGTTTIVCDVIDIVADTVTLHGNIRLEAEEIHATERLEVRPKNGTQVGWGGTFATTYPWNQIRSTLAPARVASHDDRLHALLQECSRRLRGVLTLNEDMTVPSDDPHTRWAARTFPDEFPRLMRALVAMGLATTELMSSAGSDQKVRVHLKTQWSQLPNLVSEATTEGQDLRSRMRVPA